MGKKLKQEAPAMDRNDFLKLFWTLAESDVAARTTAAAQLIAQLQHLQQQKDSTPFDDDVQYTLKRLVRGLASSRDAARQGFSAALSALLAAFPEAISLQSTLDVLLEAMEVHANMKGMEQREHMFGRLFGLLALHRSGRLTQDEDAQKITVAIVKELLEMSKWKKWLRESCVEGVLTVLSSVSPKLFVKELVSECSALLTGDVSAFNAEQVALAVGIQHYIQEHKLKELSDAKYPALHLVRRKHIHSLAEPLKLSTSCYPRVHSAWFGIFGHLVSREAIDAELFQEAWNVLVENALLAPATATHERKGLALKLFELVLPSLPSAVLRAILTPHFVKCLLNNTSSKKTILQEAARHCLKVFATQQPAEFFHFFQREFIKPMPSLVEIHGDDDEEQKKELRKTIKSGGFDAIIAIEEERERVAAVGRKTASVRLWALDHLLTELTELVQKPEQRELSEQVLRFVVFHAFFVAGEAAATPTKKKTKKASSKNKESKDALDASLRQPEPALSSNVRGVVVKRLFSLVSAQLSSETTGALHTTFTIAQDLLASGDALRVPLSSEDQTLLSSVQGHVASLSSEKSTTEEAFALLFMSCGLQLLDADQRSEALSVVADLEKCFSDLQTEQQKKKKSKKSKDEDKVDAVAVLTDLLLSLLSQDSSAMREIVTHVFKLVIPLLNATSIQSLVAVVAPEETEDGEKAAENEEEDEDEDEAMEEEEEEEEVVLSSVSDIADALRSDSALAELHREDQTLSAIAGQVKDRAAAKKNAKKQRTQVLHFKLRVLELLAVYATKCATQPLVLQLVTPLFQGLLGISNADVEQRVLKERLQSVLLHKLVKSKEVPSLVSEKDAAAQALTSLQTIVERLKTVKASVDKDLVNKVGTGVVVYLLRVLGPVESLADSLRTVVRDAAVDTFTKKHSKFPRGVFDELVTRFPRLSVQLVLPALGAIAAADEAKKKDTPSPVDEFSRAEVFRLLSLTLKPKHVAEASEQKVFTQWKTPLRTALLGLLGQKDDKQEGLKAKRLKVYLSFALQLVKTWREVAPKETKPLSELVSVVETLETSSPVIKQLIKQVASAASSTDNAKPTQTPKKKRKRSNADE
ncbi:hypothetical protein Poli38472_001516 [Pythium oligandrum]|uniref:DNA polymerase V n=1 Tax=Pythium oligandrum TaxID=41045 RepID=A0A8K1FMH1_PYTOL|nr:hypothetical protein Poli38472_001516 [Pythium oligandrum]|eukprot:TMW69360.1 hypothetical protein Poli38472_001516 [Pythium oligandrum]